ncbi:hypothetical protein Daus18300_010395 [Diaporthe australafricana]|uniref:2EXR domain-containing protein n=1 Tax=Diaporthe australafricana TaxID=127596 RepID=A0ABR3WAF2_9PEZI
MVSTRKKDYGEAPLKQRPTAATQQVVMMTHEPGPCSEFTLFPKLPGELRGMIWNESMTPRLVVVEPSGMEHKRGAKYSKTLPAQLRVDSDSRFWALRRYNLRFTITVFVSTEGSYRKFSAIWRQANVVKSPDDTLGLLGWDHLPTGVTHKFHLQSANWDGLWVGNCPETSSDGAQPEVKKVAFLGGKLASSAGFVHDLNSTITWDVNTILHTESTKLREMYPPLGSLWSTIPDPYYSMNHVLIHSRNFSGSFQEWGERLLLRVSQEAIARWRGAPDIMAFELGEQPEQISGPTHIAFDGSSSADQEGFYESIEWTWSQRFPIYQGF